MKPEDLISEAVVASSLYQDKGESATLISWTLESATKFGDNFFNVALRINLEYDMNGDKCTTSYVAKVNPCIENDKFNPYRNRAVSKEAFFYQALQPLLNAELHKLDQSSLCVPKCFYVCNDLGKEVIVLEDLKPLGFSLISRYEPVDETHLNLLMRELAKLHASSICLQANNPSQPLDKKFPLLVESWLLENKSYSIAFAEIFTKGIRHNAYIAKNLPKYAHLSDWLHKLAPVCMKYVTDQLFLKPNWNVICHGDYHTTNVMFKQDENGKAVDIRLLDWQTIRMAPPSTDIVYICHSSFFGKERDEDIANVNHGYYKALEQILPSHLSLYSFDDLCKDFYENHYGFLICFIFVPLSLCVKKSSELFQIDKEDEKHQIDPETRKLKEDEMKRILQEKPSLGKVVAQYFDECIKRKMVDNI